MLASSLVDDELELSVHCMELCLLSDVPGICAIVSSVCAVSNRISDDMTGVCMTSDGVCVKRVHDI